MCFGLEDERSNTGELLKLTHVAEFYRKVLCIKKKNKNHLCMFNSEF